MGSGVFDLNGGSQQVASVSDYSGGGGSIINSNTAAMAVLTISPTGTTTTYSGSILSGGTNGAITLVLDGNGTQVLAGANTYSGGTWVEAGTLIVNNSAALPDGSSLTVGAGGTFIFDPSVSGSPRERRGNRGRICFGGAGTGTLGLLSIGAIVVLAAAWRRSRHGAP